VSALRPLLVFGTRPEAIKMAPVVLECQRRPDSFDAIVCTTGQHREMLAQVVDHFGIRVDEQLDLMTANQSLAQLTARCVEQIDAILAHRQPDCVVAQGDTTTVMASALASFYRHVPFVHVEAGLRTGNLQAPWPEEFNRRMVTIVTALNCAPTSRAADVLKAEGVPPEKIQITGNTVIDALQVTLKYQRENETQYMEKYPFLTNASLVLITGHRRESFGEGFENICCAIADLADQFNDYQFIYPVHLNPNVCEPVHRQLGTRSNIHLVSPVSYPEFVWLMDRSTLILTDSGGVQEEAPTLHKPVLVMRETTERPEAVEAGAARLVGTSSSAIIQAVSGLLTNPAEYAACQIQQNPYGDGHAATRIADWMLESV
jgi:UDP-N-acetylglucosamine 2-epimerase (non-hydrolysing)